MMRLVPVQLHQIAVAAAAVLAAAVVAAAAAAVATRLQPPSPSWALCLPPRLVAC